MTTSEFLQLLKSHPDRVLDFEYREGEHIRPDYHITEVKNIYIEATDCGGRSDRWRETVIQLWEAPQPEPHHGPITAGKALSILERVQQSQPLLMDSVLKFEYGNAGFHTGQLHVGQVDDSAGTLLLKLDPDPTQCKARDICGVPEAQAQTSGCAPGSGCC